ncbi:MAG: protein kinase [Acidobacteria bacterium]|nr:protein kinase [Acidobacteriota bacterium]
MKITPDGRVKVLDFGLAKAFQPDSENANLSNSLTLSMAATTAGVILGTAAYMSPELAKGRTVDRRTDIFAFGCVLYEMLAGRAVFDGEDVVDILSRVLQRDPDWTRVPAVVPPSIQKLMRLCLEKDLKRRRQAAGDVRVDIEQALAEPLAVGAVYDRPTKRNTRLVWIAAVAAVALIVALAIPTAIHLRETPSAEMRLQINTPSTPAPLQFALSPDGRFLINQSVEESTASPITLILNWKP